MTMRRVVDGHDGRTLASIWRSTLAKLVGIFVAVSVLAIAMNVTEAARSSELMDELEVETATLVDLDRAILESVGPMTVMLYRSGPPERVAEAPDTYRRARAQVVAAFDDAHAALHSDHERDLLQALRAIWEGIDAAVIESFDRWSSDEIEVLVAEGPDPFTSSVWDPYGEMDAQQGELFAATTADARTKMDASQGRTRVVHVGFGFGLVVALGLMVLAGRRLSRTVLRPLARVGASAEEFQNMDQHRAIDVPGEAVVEVKRLATALNESFSSLRRSTGLLKRQASTDALTALPNRKSFTETFEHWLRAPGSVQFAVLFIDLDDFKDVNDTQGHAAGDALLQVVASRLRGVVRDTDVVARLGGDEFAVLTPIPDGDRQPAIAVAKRVLHAMQHPVHLDTGDVAIACSIGVAISDPGATPHDADELLAAADFAMYMAKGQGKNRYEIHSAAMHAEMLASAELRRGLSLAADTGQLRVHYQPIVDLGSREVLGAEALLRWQHPTRGMLAPNQFIPIAEETGAIVDIGSWVFDEACRMLAELHGSDRSLSMSINVSAKQLGADSFARKALLTANKHGVPTDRLILEITEETAILNTTAEIQELDELRSYGFHIALDDFGTGYSSLRYLGELPVDIIKIDQSFMTPDKAAMLDSIITLAQRLDLNVIAEGIEDESDLDRLRTYEHLAGQGYLFAPAMPADELLEFHHDHATGSRVGLVRMATVARSIDMSGAGGHPVDARPAR